MAAWHMRRSRGRRNARGSGVPHEVGEGDAEGARDLEQPGQAGVGRPGLYALECGAFDAGGFDEALLGEVGPEAGVADASTDEGLLVA